jgi:hypothetical protein
MKKIMIVMVKTEENVYYDDSSNVDDVNEDEMEVNYDLEENNIVDESNNVIFNLFACFKIN